jgi:phosphoribosylamine--glycine ligase
VSSFDSFDLIKIDESEKAAVCVVTVSGGYPGEYEKGFPIAGLEKINESEDLIIFHAGTKLREGIVITDGGRVLAITALADSLQNARAKAYAAVGQITFKGARNRTDIGKSQL